MLRSRCRLRRPAAASLTLLVWLAVSTGPAARSSEVLAGESQQHVVVASLERYGRGEFDDAVSQLVGTRKVRAVVKDFKKEADAWIKRAPEPEQPGRIAVVGAMTVELLAVTFTQHRDEYWQSRNIIEWACERFRRHPPSNAERWFHLSSIALAQGANDKQFIDGYGTGFFDLGSHHEHPRDRFPGDARFKLAVATANVETTLVATWPLPPGYLVTGRGLSLDYQDDSRLMDSSLQMLSELFNDPAVGAEARLRSGVLRFLRDDVTTARTDLAHAEQASEPAVRSVANLMLGTIADREGNDVEALRRYWLAYDAAPAATTSIALASRLFRSNSVDDAATVLRVFESSSPAADAWELYSQRDFRMFGAFREQMRSVVSGRAAAPAQTEAAPASRPASLTMTPAGTAPAEVRVAVLVQSAGEPVPDLKAADFSLVDSGVPQAILGVESETKRLDVTVVAPEATTSRTGKNQTFDPEIAAVAKTLTPADHLTVMLIGPDPRPFTPPGSRDLLKEAELERRCVPVYDTLARALMKPTPPDRQRVVILITTGEGRGGFLSTGPVADIARRANARVYVARVEPYARSNHIAEAQCPEVSLDFSKERQDRLRFIVSGDSTTGTRVGRNDQMMRLAAIAESTGGREIRQAILRESATGPLRDALEEIRASYVLRYLPQGVPAAGWHPVTVKVTKPGTYDIRMRPGYER